MSMPRIRGRTWWVRPRMSLLNQILIVGRSVGAGRDRRGTIRGHRGRLGRGGRGGWGRWGGLGGGGGAGEAVGAAGVVEAGTGAGAGMGAGVGRRRAR